MKVQRLFLRNVRGIKSLDLDFRDPVSGKPLSRIVLAGANGSGKTTILECIFGLLVAVEEYAKKEESIRLQDIGLNLPRTAQLQLIVSLEAHLDLSPLLSISGNQPIVNGTLALEGVTIGTDLNLQFPGRFDIFEIEAEKELSVFARLTNAIQEAYSRQGNSPGNVLYFPCDRYLPSPPQGELGFEPRTYHWAYRYKASDQWKGSTESYLFSLNYLDLEDRDRKMSGDRFSQAVGLVNSVLNGKRIARVEKGRVVVETANGETHGLDDLSSGEKQLVLLLVEINRRIVPGSVLVIDEPEISLHPTWQRGFLAVLDKIVEQYDAQVILATHSLEIATSVMPHEVINLSDLDDLPRGEWKPEIELTA